MCIRDSNLHTWGFQIYRQQGRRIEEYAFQNFPGFDGVRWVSTFGELRNLNGIKPKLRREITPYVLAGIEKTSTPVASGVNENIEERLNIGLGFNVGLSSSWILSGSINPDFGQIEADPAILNLSDREFFFEERRPLFSDNASFLRLQLNQQIVGGSINGQQLFYSRRIGAPPHLSGRSVGSIFSEDLQTTVLGAVRLNGRFGKNRITLFSALTDQEDTIAFNEAEQSIEEFAIEPRTTFNATQISRDFNEGRTSFKAMGTYVHRLLDDTNINSLHTNAFSLGSVLSHRFNKSNWVSSARVASSRVSGSSESLTITQNASQRYI